MNSKRVFKIVGWGILGIIVLALLLFVLLWAPPVQQKIKDIALTELTKMTGSQISITSFRFYPFNKLKLTDVYVEDLQQDTLLYVSDLTATFDLIPLLKNNLVIKSVDVSDFAVHVTADSLGSPYNFQFLIDAFQGDTTKTDDNSSQLIIRIDDVKLNNGSLNYSILSEPQMPDSTIDYNHLSLYGLYADMNLHSIDLNALNVRLNKLQFTEKSGLRLDNLLFALTSKDEVITLSSLSLELPNSQLQGDLSLDYTGYELAEVLNGASYQLKLSSEGISTQDIRYLYPEAEQFPEILSLYGELKGTFPEIRLNDLQLQYGDQFSIAANGYLKDMNRWETAPFSLRLDSLKAAGALVDSITGVSMPTFALNGSVNGTLTDFDVNLLANASEGNLSLKGNGGYVMSTSDAHFNLDLQTEHLNLADILQNEMLGTTTVSLGVRGSYSGTGNINAHAEAFLQDVVFNDYHYKDIDLKGFYIGDSLALNVVSADTNLLFNLDASANLAKTKEYIQLTAGIDRICLDTLHFLSDYKDPVISAQINAEIQGLNPDLMDVSLFITDLLIQANDASFKDDKIELSYKAKSDLSKELNIKSKIIGIMSRGVFTLDGISNSIQTAFPIFFASDTSVKKKTSTLKYEEQKANLVVILRQTNSIMPLLGYETQIPDSALFVARYVTTGESLDLSATAFCLFSETDTVKLSIAVQEKEENLGVSVSVDNKSDFLNVNGSLAGNVEFLGKNNTSIPDMNLTIQPTTLTVNDSRFNVRPSTIILREDYYEFQDFALEHSDEEYIRLKGIASKDSADELSVQIKDLQIKTILDAIRNPLPLTGALAGDVILRQALANPMLFTRKLAVNDIVFNNNPIGDLNLISGWNPNRNALAFMLRLLDDDIVSSSVNGFYSPATDSMSVSGDIKHIKLAWLSDYLQETLYGLDGELGAKFSVKGTLDDPKMMGEVYFNESKLGVKMLNTLYTLNDTLTLDESGMEIKNLLIKDENNKTAKIEGKITYPGFSAVNGDLKVQLDDFLVLNNASQKDSLFYGNLKLRGSLSLTGQNAAWTLRGNLRHGRNGSIMINIPTSSTEAVEYNSVTFINTENEKPRVNPALANTKEKKQISPSSFALNIENLMINVTPELSVGAIYNPSTGDRALVEGTGNIDFSYNMNSGQMKLLGFYKINEGTCTLSLKNITKKTFKIEEGGQADFNGDPLATSFDVTAIYSLRADLKTLDAGFADIGLSSTKVPVNCVLSVSGNLDKMQLNYDIELPKESEETQRRVNGLIYNENDKIKQIAYLLAIGSFMPADDSTPTSGGGNVWTSLASSSITNQLNNLLAGVLSDNWSIGTDLHTNDSNFSDVEMDVNISTNLFDDRLTISSTLGYKSHSTQTENFTGDFNLEYKLTSSGNLILQFYNVTNNDYFINAKMIRGLGLIYRREAKTMKQLFRLKSPASFRQRIQQNTDKEEPKEEQNKDAEK